MSSTEFCLLWDNFFVPADQLTNKPVAIKTKHVMPVFCQQSRDIDLDAMQVLWDLKKPKEEDEKRQKKDQIGVRRKSGTGRERRRRRRRTTQKIDALQLDDEMLGLEDSAGLPA